MNTKTHDRCERLSSASEKSYDAPVTPKEIDRMPGSEDCAKRTRSGKLYSLGRSLYQAVLYPDPIHYQDKATGRWEEIDNTLEQRTDSAGDVYLTNRKNDELQVELHNAQNAAMVLLENDDGYMLAWHLEGAENVHPQPTARRCPLHTDCDHRRAVLDHLEDEAVYTGILPGVDIHCRVQSVSFKDDIVFAGLQSVRPLSFLLSVADLVPSAQEDGEIRFVTPQGDIPFVLPAPFLKDSSTGSAYGRVSVSLSPTEERDVWRMTYTPDEAWLQSAVFPVVLDPAVISRKHSNAIEDNYVTSAQPGTCQPYAGTSMKVSYNNGSWGTSKAFIKFLGSGLPDIDSSYYITKAFFSIATRTTPTAAASIYLKEALSDWSSRTITYNNAPPLNNLALDYMYMESGSTFYTYDISNLVRKWYAGTNYGFALESNTSTYIELYSSDDVYNKPFVTINYVSLAGLEDYLAYEEQPVGRAGTGYVSLYNGNLIFEHTDTACNGNLLPLSATHYYNSCYHDLDIFHAGLGWKISLEQCLMKQTLPGITGNITYYIYMDADGTQHYFEQKDGVWKDLSGLSLTLEIDGNIATVKDKMDNLMFFALPTSEFNGDYSRAKMLQEIRDASGNLGTLELLEARQLIRTTDGAGRVTAYRILEDGRTEAIIAPGYTDETGVHFVYDEAGRLIQILHEDGKASSYTYNALGLLESATDVDGLKVSYEYYTERKPYRVKKATVSNGTVAGNSRLFEYGDCLTVVTDLTVPDGKKLYYHFNDYGNVVSVNDGLGYACFAKYEDSLPVNHPEVVSKMQRVVCNYIKNHSFEGNDDWYFYNPTSGNSVGYASDAYYLGSRSAKVTIGPNLGFASASQLVALEKGKDYTFSFYARRTGNVDVRIQVNIGDYVVSSAGYGSDMTAEFKRFSYTFTVPEDAATDQARIYLVAENAVGSAWFDCVQLEQGPLMNQYNVLVNGDFSFNLGAPQGWKANASNTSADAVYATYDGVKPEGLTANTFRMYGAGRTKYAGIYQDLSLSGKKGDVYTAGGWSLNHSKPRKGENFRYNIRVSFLPVNGGARQNAPSIEWSEEWSQWQFAAGPVVAPCDYSYIRFNVDYERNINYTDFDGFFMYREEFGQTYQYDGKGNILSTKNLAGQQDDAAYDSFNNLISYRQPGRASTVKTTLEYGATDDEKKRHLLRKSTSPLGVVQTFNYDAVGNMTDSKSSAAGTAAFIQSATAYDAAKNYPVSQTDARGKSSVTGYDAIAGTLSYVQDANGQRVDYTYDLLKRLKETTASADGVTYRNEYVYSDANRLTVVKHNTTSDTDSDVTYTFDYDALGNPTTVKVGAQTLSTNVYTDTGDKLLTRVEYGNGGKVHYKHDAFKRVTGVRYDADMSDRYQYVFGANGQVGQVVDRQLSRTAFHDYDAADRLMQLRLVQGTTPLYTSRLEYDVFNNLSSLKETVGTTGFTTTFDYDAESRPTGAQYGSAANQVAYAYDALGRLSARTLTVNGMAYPTAYAYVQGGYGADSTTPLVETITQSGHELGYIYDDVGNIAGERRNQQMATYGYDALGQLTRVNDPYQDKTFTYVYDRGGNMLVKKTYAYTTGPVTGDALQTVLYTYGDANWKDKLTAYDGKAITYDAIGNPLTYDGWSFTWMAGRQLTAMSKAGVNASFTYNADGLRVRKTVNGVVTDYTLHGKQVVHMKRGDDDLHFFYDMKGQPAIVDWNGSKYGYVLSLQGDVIALIDSTGATVVEYRYDAWGAPVAKTGPLAATLGALNPFRYRGYVFDEETGLYYLRSRYYHSNWCRFINADSIHTRNLFLYCQNNTLIRSDESGQFSFISIIVAAVAVATAVIAITKSVTNRKKSTAKKYDASVTLPMRKMLSSSSLYAYTKKGHIEPTSDKIGLIDCAYAIYEAMGQTGLKGATLRYYDCKERGAINSIGGLDALEVGMEVFQFKEFDDDDKMIMKHVGKVVMYDFGNGLEKAVFHSVTSELSPDNWKAMFYGDTGPNITSLARLDGSSNWTHYGIPR